VMWDRMARWGKGLKQTDLDALAVLRQAQHLNADSMPGRPVDPVDVERPEPVLPTHGEGARP